MYDLESQTILLTIACIDSVVAEYLQIPSLLTDFGQKAW